MHRIIFTEVGRAKKNWTVELPGKDLTEAMVIREARKGAVLMSQDLQASCPDEETGEGILHAGMHTVGRFRTEYVNQ